MATADENAKIQELNFILKSLGERGKEGELWQDHAENISGYLLQQLSELLGKKFENDLVLRPYGSAAEDLKRLEPDDVGDVDIVIFPNSENSTIHDQMIEYLPEHLMHVRIKGVDHPVLQSCLVEDTEYVATTAIKNFHPAIYGSSVPHWMDYLTRVLQLTSREGWCNTSAQWKNNEACPALQVNYTQLFGPLSGEVEKTNDPQNWTNLDPAEWEWLVHNICASSGTEYTKEHAKIINEYFEFVNEVRMSNKGVLGLPQTFPILFHELVHSDRVKQLRARVLEIDRRSQNDSRRKEVCSAEGATPKPCHENENGRNEETEINEDANDKKEQKKNENINESQNEFNTGQQSLAEKSELSYKTQQRYPDFKSLSSGTDFIFDHLFAPVTEESKAAFEGTEGKDTDEAPIMGGFDLVPALRCRGWPRVSRDWIKRERKWPSPDTVDKVIREGFHLVVKPPKNGGNPDCDFRLSFSHAEYLLSQEMNDVQRECYRCLKKFHREYLSKDLEPKALVSFHLKNLLLQTIEETGPEIWTESNRAECVMKLFGNLAKALVKKDLRHFFVRSYNLFGVDYIESPEILDVLAGKAEEIMENPLQFAKELIQKDEAANQVRKEKCVPNSKTTATTASAQRDETTPNGNNEGQTRHEPLTDSVQKDAKHQESNANRNYRFHDLKDIYLATSDELTKMAFNDANHTLEALDPLEKSLVQDLREMMTNHPFQVDEFRKMFDAFWGMVYWKVWMNPEPNMRRRMLDAIQGVIEAMKYMLRQKDFAPENAEAIAKRVLDPNAEDRFDWSHLLPAGIGTRVFERFVNSFELRSAPQRAVDHLDDIPLD